MFWRQTLTRLREGKFWGVVSGMPFRNLRPRAELRTQFWVCRSCLCRVVGNQQEHSWNRQVYYLQIKLSWLCLTYQGPAGGQVAAVRAENPSWLPTKSFCYEMRPTLAFSDIVWNGGPRCQALASFGGHLCYLVCSRSLLIFAWSGFTTQLSSLIATKKWE